jgi:hypothetical protein
MHWDNRNRTEEEVIELLRDISKTLHQMLGVERRIEKTDEEILDHLTPQLSFIKIAFSRGDNIMAQGPVTLSSGQSTTATVLYFDQTGAPMPSTFVPPAVTYTIDNSAIASSTPGADGQSDQVAYVTAGVANLTAAVTSAEGLALSDTETVTDSPIIVPPPVLSSIKIDFSTPTPAAAAAVRK